MADFANAVLRDAGVTGKIYYMGGLFYFSNEHNQEHIADEGETSSRRFAPPPPPNSNPNSPPPPPSPNPNSPPPPPPPNPNPNHPPPPPPNPNHPPPPNPNPNPRPPLPQRRSTRMRRPVIRLTLDSAPRSPRRRRNLAARNPNPNPNQPPPPPPPPPNPNPNSPPPSSNLNPNSPPPVRSPRRRNLATPTPSRSKGKGKQVQPSSSESSSSSSLGNWNGAGGSGAGGSDTGNTGTGNLNGTTAHAIKVALIGKIVCLDAVKILINEWPTISTPKNKLELYAEAGKLTESYFQLTPPPEIFAEFSDILITILKTIDEDNLLELFVLDQMQLYFRS